MPVQNKAKQALLLDAVNSQSDNRLPVMKNTPLPLFLAEDFPLPARFGDSLSPLRFLPPDLPGDLSLPPLLEPDERIQYNHNKKQTIYSVRFGGRNRNAVRHQ